MSKRDDFPQSVIRIVALRAGYLCSNPDCRKPTSGPHSDPAKAIITGQAAHICAAAEGGPRYHAQQTPEQRKDIRNAIWLCGNCNKKVDTDWLAWPAEKLHDMKFAHERWIAAEAMIPTMPFITLTTRQGLRLHPSLPEINAEIQQRFREQEFHILNPNRVELFNLSVDLTMPESGSLPGIRQVPTGPTIKFGPIRPALTGIVKGTGSITPAPPVETPHFRLEIDRLPAMAEFIIAFYTRIPEQTMAYQMCKTIPDVMEDPEKMDEHKICHYHIEGSYQFLLRGEYVSGTVFVPLLYRAHERMIVSYPVQDTCQPWKVWEGFVASGAKLQVAKSEGSAGG